MKITSDYALAQHLDVDASRISNWRGGRNYPDAGICIQLAGIIREEPVRVIADVEIERSKNNAPRRLYWTRIRELALTTVMAIGAASFGGFNNNVFAGNSTPASSSESGHKYTLRRYQRRRAVLGVAL